MPLDTKQNCTIQLLTCVCENDVNTLGHSHVPDIVLEMVPSQSKAAGMNVQTEKTSTG